MFVFDWIRRNVAEAVRQGFQDSLEREPLIRSAPGPPSVPAAAEQLLLPEPANKRIAKK